MGNIGEPGLKGEVGMQGERGIKGEVFKFKAKFQLKLWLKIFLRWKWNKGWCRTVWVILKCTKTIGLITHVLLFIFLKI